MNRRQLFLSTAKAALFGALGIPMVKDAHAQSPTATQFPDSKALPTPTPPFSGFIQPNLINSQPGWPPAVMPPEGAPNGMYTMPRATSTVMKPHTLTPLRAFQLSPAQVPKLVSPGRGIE